MFTVPTYKHVMIVNNGLVITQYVSIYRYLGIALSICKVMPPY